MVLCVAAWCSVLQCVAVMCSVLQHSALCRSVVHCGAVCCSMVQRVAIINQLGGLFSGFVLGKHSQKKPYCRKRV